MMTRITSNICLVVFSTIISLTAWSQCPTVDCPVDTIISTDSLNCGAVFTYTAPIGLDTCSITSQGFTYTGTIDNWTVPAGVTSVTIEAKGAQGSNNTISGVVAGLGAVMIGDFIVTPGQVLSILVGQQYAVTDGNGGGGGTFVVDAVNNPLIIAGGGGGSSESVDSPDKHGQIGTSGGLGAGGGGLGGIAGNGGAVGATFASGAGGGLLTDGADGWAANSGGDAFVNGGAGANIGFGVGGFGGGGNGSGYVVGGAGGGYSGGGCGSNSLGGGPGGGGGSINLGTNPNNTAGLNTGHGSLVITWAASTTTTFESGIGSGGSFPVGITTESFSVVNALGDSAFCSFTVTVVDSISPIITVPVNYASCDPVVNGISASGSDNCPGITIAYTLTGATTGSGSNDASGITFSVGTTTVWYILTDASGNQDSSSFDVVINPLPVVSLSPFTIDTLCIDYDPIPLPMGSPTPGMYSGTGVSGNSFDPALAGNGSYWILYTFTDSLGCTSSDSSQITVDGCLGIDGSTDLIGLMIYPNPGVGIYTIEFDNGSMDQFEIEMTDVNGKIVYLKTSSEILVNQKIDIREEAQGIYFLEIRSESHSSMHKIIKN
ncbi:MAG: hypothetical protein ACI865_000505 [Flavobacteriaceae bacterium]|jgi:hypothetical protein